MANELAGRVALITGAAHGQGRATALALAREGVHIAALDVRARSAIRATHWDRRRRSIRLRRNASNSASSV